MNVLISTRIRILVWAILAFILAACAVVWFTWRADSTSVQQLTDGDIMTRFLAIPLLLSIAVFGSLTACASRPAASAASNVTPTTMEPPKPFMAQVVGVQWLNPLQRRDYPTEWQLLWTLGLVKPNENDDMVKAHPRLFSTLQTVGMIAAGSDGMETFDGYHEKYINKLLVLFHDIYFSSSRYFYNVHSKDKSTWRELAGIRVEYALPEGKLDPVEAATFTRKEIIKMFNIGNTHSPTTWSHATPPDVRITMGGANAGFTSLAAALDYLKAHPSETVWAMNWDAPSRPLDKQINENMVLLVLAGPDYKTGRNALAWVGYPASKAVADFEAQKGQPHRVVQAWTAVLDEASRNAGKQSTDIGYVIHDANNTHVDSSDRLGNLGQTLSTELVEFDFIKQSFNTPARLGEMGAGTALTNVALGIAYANHFGKHVLVAGTTDKAGLIGLLVVPPATIRPIIPDEPWFRARGENNAYLMWWGLRHDASPDSQGYSK